MVVSRLQSISKGIRNTNFYRMMIANRKDKNNTIQVLNQNLTGKDPKQVPMLPIDDLPMKDIILTYEKYKELF